MDRLEYVHERMQTIRSRHMSDCTTLAERVKRRLFYDELHQYGPGEYERSVVVPLTAARAPEDLVNLAEEIHKSLLRYRKAMSTCNGKIAAFNATVSTLLAEERTIVHDITNSAADNFAVHGLDPRFSDVEKALQTRLEAFRTACNELQATKIFE